MARRLYTLLLYLLLPWIPLRLWWRGRRTPGYRLHWLERWGYGPRIDGQRPVIWLHCVSVGETRAAQPLLVALRAACPDAIWLLTHMTPTGRETGMSLFGEDVLRSYLPYDFPWAVRRFLRRARPSLGILLETELWFNLIAECRDSRIPVVLLNARLSARSAQGYARFAALTQPALQALPLIAAQSAADAERFVALGASHVTVMGNTKFDLQPPPTLMARGRDWRQRWGARPVLVVASTRDGEEALLMSAIAAAAIPDLLTILVPRHPERWVMVEKMLLGRGIRVQRRSVDLTVAADVAVLLGDSMGEMYAYYAAADLAVIGGSWLPLGGQNLIEANAVGCPVVVGPHMFNFAEATKLACAAGAAVQVADGTALAAELRRLFADPAARQAMSVAAQRFAEQHRGATGRAMAQLEPWLPGRYGA